MSGIVAVINLDGAPADRQLLQQMTAFMAYRGPDAHETWSDGQLGFGHTMLRTTPESIHEHQPCSLDGKVWITADARVDDRPALTEKLKSKGRTILEGTTDVELILHAYHTWGEDCVNHLLGDFAFAIWDGRRRRLFCARDHFGVKLLYYAHLANSLIVSNTLNCVRMHPAVSDDLNDLAIGDFLLFGFNHEPSTTTFADVQRLPPAHCLTCSEGTLRLSRYWTLPTDGHTRYKRPKDYVEHFKELLRTAVHDRLRTDRVGVFMSGGLDSPAVAATARELLSSEFASFDLRAYTVVYDKLIPDKERRYAGLVAAAMRIPIHFLVADNYSVYERSDRLELLRPEPIYDPLLAIFVDQLKHSVTHSRAALTGWDGDTVMCEQPSPYFGALFKNRRFGRLVVDMWRYVWSQRELPPIGFRTKLRYLLGKRSQQRIPYPTWLSRAFEKRLDLRARWEQINADRSPIHPSRPGAYRALGLPTWSYLFESYDAGITRFPLEVRHPLIDLRMVNYLLSIPPVPWCIKKELLRVAMRGVLPEPVRLRPKAPLAGDPVSELLRNCHAHWLHDFASAPQLAHYVDRSAVRPAPSEDDPNKLWLNLRPFGLNSWLQRVRPISYTSEKRGVL